MAEIKYEFREGAKDFQIRVTLDGKFIGNIRPLRDSISIYGYRYFPKGASSGGEMFRTLDECKGSLES